jgi:hypothetical protein
MSDTRSLYLAPGIRKPVLTVTTTYDTPKVARRIRFDKPVDARHRNQPEVTLLGAETSGPQGACYDVLLCFQAIARPGVFFRWPAF